MMKLSASKVGFPCDRHLWYAAYGLREEIRPEAKRIFAVGSVLESLVVRFMKEDGYQVIHNDKNHYDPTDFVIYLKGGILTGRHDITFAKPGKTIYEGLVLGDIKTMNSRAYVLWRRKGTQEKYPQYVRQLTVYYYGLKEVAKSQFLNGELAIVGFNKDNSTYAIDYFDYQPELWEEIKDRCERIFSCKEPPEPKEIPAWACGYCGYRNVCDARPEKVTEDNGFEAIDDQEVELAAYMLAEARSLSAQARDLEKEAKAVLERLKDKERVRVGSYLIKITPSRSSRLDTKALKTAHPDIYTAFLKETVSYRYDVKEIV